MGKLNRFATISVLVLTLAALRCGSPSEAPAKPAEGAGAKDTSSVVATFAGQTITLNELERENAAELKRIEQERFDSMNQRLDQIVNQRLIEAEASTRSLTQAQLFETEIMAKVVAPTEQEVQAFWDQVKAQAGGQTLDSLRPRIVDELNKRKAQTMSQQFLMDLRSKANLQVNLEPPRYEVPIPEGEPSKGPANAPVTFIEFADFDCPFCRNAHPAVERLLNEYGDQIRYVFRDFPLAMHQRAAPAAEAARCAGEQGKYWDYYSNLMKEAGDLSDQGLRDRATKVGLDVNAFNLCYDSRRYKTYVEQALNDGTALGITGTPTFFINGRMIVGAKSYEDMKAVIEDELRRAGAKS